MIDEAGVHIDVRTDGVVAPALFLQKLRADRLDLLQQLEILCKALDLCQMSRIRLDQHRARVGERIDRMSKAVNFA